MIDVTNPQKLKETLVQANSPFPRYGVKQTPTPLDQEKSTAYAEYEKDHLQRIRRVINSKQGPPHVATTRSSQGANQPAMFKFLGKYGVNMTKTPIVMSAKLPSSPIRLPPSSIRLIQSRQNSETKLQDHYAPNRHARSRDLNVPEGTQTSRSRQSRNRGNILNGGIKSKKQSVPLLTRPYIDYPYRGPTGAHSSYLKLRKTKLICENNGRKDLSWAELGKMSMSDINGITEEKFEPLNLMVSDDEEDKLYLEGYNLEVEDAASIERKRQVELQCQSYGKIKKYSFLQKQRISEKNFGATPRGFGDGDTDRRGNHLERYYRKNNYKHDYAVDYMQQYGTRPAQSGGKVYQAYKDPSGSQHYFGKKSRPAQGMTANDKNRHTGGQQDYHCLENLGIDQYLTKNNK
jgi:hypothetical protein